MLEDRLECGKTSMKCANKKVGLNASGHEKYPQVYW